MHQAYDVSVNRVQIRCSRSHSHIDPIGEVVDDRLLRAKNIHQVNATDQRSLGTMKVARKSVESAKKATSIESNKDT